MDSALVQVKSCFSRQDFSYISRLLQVAQLQERLIELEEAALSGHFEATEAQRLADENTLLAAQMKQMEVNVKVCFSSYASSAYRGFFVCTKFFNLKCI